MNRLEHLADCLLCTSTTAAQIESGKFSASQTPGGPAVFSPIHYERNYAYPLIVWLHGPRDDERQLKRVMPQISMRNYVAVAPRGPSSVDGQRGFHWSQTEADIDLAETRVLDAVDHARARFKIAAQRIFIAGFGCGGAMAFRLALQNPRVFAGALSLGGAFPTGHAPLSRLLEARRVRLFMATGRDSKLYPEQHVCEDLRLIHTAGMSVSLRQYPCGDELTTHMLADMDRWIMEQLSSLTPATHSAASRPAYGH